MSRLLLVVICLVAPASSIGAMPWARSPVARPLFETSKLPSSDEAEEKTSPPFEDFALGSVFNVYPYQAVWNDGSANVATHGSVPLPGWLEVRGAPLFTFNRGVGLSADAYASFLIFGAGGAVRYWGREHEQNSTQSVGYGWLGLTAPLLVANVSVGVAFGQVALPNGETPAGFLFSTRFSAYPLWPLSLSGDLTVGGMAGGVLDAGFAVGGMAFRNLFVEVGYRYSGASSKGFAAHGITFGFQFVWNWTNPRFSPFKAPSRPNTW